jgi:adenosine/AMP kinase
VGSLAGPTDRRSSVKLVVVPIEKPEDLNVILGQAHFIKTVEDLHEVLVGSSPHLRFGLAFCEASGKCLVRHSGNDPELEDLAVRNALALAVGHCFVVFVREGYPVNVLNQLKQVPEVCTVHCATANQVEVVLAESDLGRGVLGVIDGSPPRGVETDQDMADRKSLLRSIGYKL